MGLQEFVLDGGMSVFGVDWAKRGKRLDREGRGLRVIVVGIRWGRRRWFRRERRFGRGLSLKRADLEKVDMVMVMVNS
jgi:hypothetical protein